MFYLRHGNGTQVFLLHGFCGSSAAWSGCFEALAEKFDVIAPDWPGFGQSADLAPYRSIEAFAAGLVELADRLSIERFAVVGHSIGSFVAQQLMVTYPHRVDAAVLYGAGLRVDDAVRFESTAQTIEQLRLI